MNSISNELASEELVELIALRADLIDCISSSHFFISSRASSSVISLRGVDVVDSAMMEQFAYCSFFSFRTVRPCGRNQSSFLSGFFLQLPSYLNW